MAVERKKDADQGPAELAAEKTAKENKYPWFAKVHKTQREFDVLWKGASSWRTVKVKE